MRLFVALWPDDVARDVLERLDRRAESSVRWTGRGEWHVTLRFLGDVPDGDVHRVTAAMTAAARAMAPRTIMLGPATTRLGKGQLVLPAAGADDLATAVVEATAELGRPREDRPFTAHLTVARGRGRRPVPRELEGSPLTTSWVAEEVALVRSHLEAGGPRYETIARAPLAG